MDSAADRILKEFQRAFKGADKAARARLGGFCGFSQKEAARIQQLRRRALLLKGDSDAADRARAVAKATAGLFKAERYQTNDGTFPLIDADDIWRVGEALWGKTETVEQTRWVL